jgi:hypothetical protein
MKCINRFLAVCLIGSLVGCAAVTAKSDYDRQTDFSQYKTFNWLARQGSGFPNPLSIKRVQTALESGLIAKGFQLQSSPDLLVVFHGATQDQVNITDWGYGYRGGWGGSRNIDVHKYTEGTLIVDFIDAEKKELIWRGWATAVMDKPDKNMELINEAVAKILAEFPPTP